MSIEGWLRGQDPPPPLVDVVEVPEPGAVAILLVAALALPWRRMIRMPVAVGRL